MNKFSADERVMLYAGSKMVSGVIVTVTPIYPNKDTSQPVKGYTYTVHHLDAAGEPVTKDYPEAFLQKV